MAEETETFHYVTVVLLGLAAVTTGWAAYQSAVWETIHIETITEAAEMDRRASGLEVEAGQTRLLDMSVVEAFVSARLRHDQAAADFYLRHLRPVAKAAVDSWLAKSPFDNPNYIPQPVEMPEYSLPQTVQASQLHEGAESLDKHADHAAAVSASYVLGTVAAAFISLFAGLSESTKKRGRLYLTIAAVAFVFTTLWILSRPVAALGGHLKETSQPSIRRDRNR